MAKMAIQMGTDGEAALKQFASHFDSQLNLLPTRISTIYPRNPIGKHVRFLCAAVDGGDYHCKSDADGRPIRATEWFAHSLALHLGIAVPDFRVMEGLDGETLFGSRQAISTASVFEVRDYLTQKKVNEFGGPTDWFGQWLSGLYVLDMFLNNPDRGLANFVLEKNRCPERLCVIDFADAHLEDIASHRFPVATSNTVCMGRFFERFHGFSLDSALEMVEKIRVIPLSVIDRIFGEMPIEWIEDGQKQQIREAWSHGQHALRLSALRAGLEDGSRR